MNIIPSLRTEVIEAQKTRSDLLKWKLVLVAILGAAGLGLSAPKGNTTIIHVELVLCCIPFVCAYVDLLCSNLNLRMILIGAYLKKEGIEYENFVSNKREEIFKLEDWVLYFSSYILSVIIIIIGIIGLTTKNSIDDSVFWTLVGSGTLGFFFSIVVRRKYLNLKKVASNERNVSKKTD